MLSEVREELIKDVKLTIGLESLTDEFMEGLQPFINKGSKKNGGKLLRFQIVDNETNLQN